MKKFLILFFITASSLLADVTIDPLCLEVTIDGISAGSVKNVYANYPGRRKEIAAAINAAVVSIAQNVDHLKAQLLVDKAEAANFIITDASKAVVKSVKDAYDASLPPTQ